MPGKGLRSRSNAKSVRRRKGTGKAPIPPRANHQLDASVGWQPISWTSILRKSSSVPELKFLAGGEGSSSSSCLLSDPDSCSNMLCSYSSSSSLSSFSSFYSAPLASSSSLNSEQCYNRESKVVVNVVVEGSPGPIRTMVKLGSSVEETIKLVLEKFQQERRNPNFQDQASSSYELHHSFFSLESLNKSSPIGDAGSRNLYLRKSSRSLSRIENEDETRVPNTELEIKPRSSRSCSVTFCLLIELFVRRFGHIPVQTCNAWKTILCL